MKILFNTKITFYKKNLYVTDDLLRMTLCKFPNVSVKAHFLLFDTYMIINSVPFTFSIAFGCRNSKTQCLGHRVVCFFLSIK